MKAEVGRHLTGKSWPPAWKAGCAVVAAAALGLCGGAVAAPARPVRVVPEKSVRADVGALEAAVRAGDRAKIGQLMKATGWPETPESSFWRAQALAAQGKWSAAADLAGPLATAAGGPFFQEALLGVAAWRVEAGEPEAALAVLKPALGSTDPGLAREARLRTAALEIELGRPEQAGQRLLGLEGDAAVVLLRARVLLALSRPAEAVPLLETLAAAEQGGAAFMAQLLLARARAAEGMLPVAVRQLVELIPLEVTNPQLGAAFALLEETGALAGPSVRPLLATWEANPEPNLAALAVFYRAAAAQAAGEPAAAADGFRGFVAKFPEHPLHAEALVRLAEISLAEKQAASALAAVTDLARVPVPSPLRARAAVVSGQTNWATAHFAEAQTHFQEAADLTRDPGKKAALQYNASLAAVLAGGGADLRGLGSRPDLQATLLLESGLAEAAADRPEAAEDTLQRFLRDFTTDPRAVAAQTALAELSLTARPPRPVEARQLLRLARAYPGSPALAARHDWLAVWIEDADNRPDAAVDLAVDFLKKHEDDPLRRDLRLKLAELYLRRGEPGPALQQYQKLGEETTEDDGSAWFLAAGAASRLPTPAAMEKALGYYQEAAKADEDFALPARFQQAVIRTRQGRTDQALELLDSLLSAKPPPTEPQRLATLCARGEILLLPSTATGQTRPAEALETFDRLLALKDLPAGIRQQALCRRGQCLNKLGRLDEALALWTDLAASLDTASKREAEWPTRAAFAALDVLTKKKDWSAALALANRLARSRSARAPEARDLASRLRLEHFVWDEPGK